ncbi:MAG: Maf family protein [Ghiorsea sp.]
MFNVANMPILTPHLILASQSPRRLQLLQAAGYHVDVRPSHIDESPLTGETTQAMTMRLCQEKAKACVVDVDHPFPVVAADTLVAIHDEALGQPKDWDEAKSMIQKLSGHEHQVHTAVCVRIKDACLVEMVTTLVRFRQIADAEIDVYLQHNDIMDKAGSYAIQGGASSFITSIEGSLDNVIGLPVQQTKRLIAAALQQCDQGKKT